MTRADAFVAQARSDYRVFRLLLEADRQIVPECHPLHYLQMATEKLAKAAMSASDVEHERYSHIAFSTLPRQLARRDVARKLGYPTFDAYRAFLRRTAPLFRRIDELNPSVGPAGVGTGAGNSPNVEYPWLGRDELGSEAWVVPARFSFGIAGKATRRGDFLQVLRFVEALLHRFDTIFV